MPRLRVIAPLAFFPLLLSACGESDTISGGPSGTTIGGAGNSSTSTTTTTGGGGATSTSSGGTGGATTTSSGGAGGVTGGAAGAGGATTTSTNTLCGNGAVDVGEVCDGEALGGATCVSLGYPGGQLACGPTCNYDLSTCEGSENCIDGLDNDGDSLVDCEEPKCASECGSACQSPPVLGDGDDPNGTTTGHANSLQASCVAQSGPDVAYVITPTQTGALDLTLFENGSGPLSVSVRTACGSAASEIGCSNSYAPGAADQKMLSVPVTIGQPVFVVIDGDGAASEGPYILLAVTRALFCGDGYEDAPEACDDGNMNNGDGCSATCQVEANEVEQNGTLQTANLVTQPWFAEIAPAGDQDLVKITLAQAGGLAVWTDGVGNGRCFDGSMDSMITLLDSGGQVLASNDDHAGGCSLASAANLAAGTYYARIQAGSAASAASETFPYRLFTSTFQCGDGTVAVGEECDDGNAMNGDGCTSACKVEVNETEPNNTVALADTYSSPWIARVDPDGDVDVVTVNVPAAGGKIIAKTSDPTGGSGCLSAIDTFVEVLDSAGSVIAVNDDVAGGYCSSVTAMNLAAGKYHVRVQAPPVLGASNVYIYSYKLDIQVQ